MEKLAENDLTYFYFRHVVIVVSAITRISLTSVISGRDHKQLSRMKYKSKYYNLANDKWIYFNQNVALVRNSMYDFQRWLAIN